MSDTTIADIQNEIAALRREISELRAVPAVSSPQEQAEDPTAALRRNLAEKGEHNGITVMHRISQVSDRGSGSASYSRSFSGTPGLPTDEQIAEKITRLSPLIQNPLALRALRRLAEPHFEGRDKRRSKADLAASLGVGEAEVEAALAPLLDHYEVTWGKDSSGQEYYEWTGNSFAMTLLIHG